MTIGLLKLLLFIPQSNSLKAKRMALQGLKVRLRRQFNIALSEVDNEDKWQKAVLALVSLDKDRNRLNSLFSKVVNFVEGTANVNLIDYEMEFF
jgi:uncharacterized protein YlxP (DUF503 family)